MTTSARRPNVVTLNQLSDVVAAVPHLLGFHPTESLVAVAMTGRRERLSFSMRVDLPEPADEPEVVAVCVRAMRRAKADRVLLFVYTDDDHPQDELPREGLVERLVTSLPVPVCDALLVTDERVWSYLCADPVCCPSEGRRRERDTPGSLALAAAHALQGRSVLPSRDAVLAALAVPDDDVARLELALDRAAEAFLTAGESAERAGAATLLDDLLERYADPPAVVSADEAALLAVALHDIPFRDAAVLRCIEQLDDARALFGDLVRGALPPLDPPVCTLLAVAAYLQGDGPVAAVALERALRSNPDYGLAGLLATALQGQVSPADVRRALTGSTPRPRRSGRRR